ncbi:MAG: 16S rRNA (guanine(966)-N(2))-methyltransferase RsmD [Actinomycetota bacterium]|nr:16S rRNA (guanine(966)-N(2))-methyltransferase RsmD [Actinomycetota bacterium]MDZ4179593.1 16S rRNA (guanine(966)-N(2))-methyltransferase RsmD [Coriobacteriia bacterium]
MRIIAGEFRGRRIVAPKGVVTRPTSDRVREALFSRLESLGALTGATVLDAYAGSGSLGLESLSRGALRVLFIETDRSALKSIQANIAALGVEERATALPGDPSALAVRGHLPGSPYSLLLLDPPYRIDKAEVAGLIEAVLSKRGLTDGAHVTWEHRAGEKASWPAGFSSLGSRRYGDTEVDVAVYDEGNR